MYVIRFNIGNAERAVVTLSSGFDAAIADSKQFLADTENVQGVVTGVLWLPPDMEDEEKFARIESWYKFLHPEQNNESS